MQMPSSISAAMNRTLLALSRASFKAEPPSPQLFLSLLRFSTSSILHFAFISAVSLWLALLWRCGAWALSGSSKQAQIMNRVRKQLADYGRRREGGGEGNGCTHWYSIECLVEACLEQ